MRRILRAPVVLADEAHRVTPFEVFFDLVFVFAFTRTIAFMAHDLTPLALVRGLLLLALLWWSWSAYSWLGNQARADVGLARAGAIAAMAAIFVVALTIPQAWEDVAGGLNGPLTVAVAYTVVRVLYLSTYLYASAGDRTLRHQLLLSAIPLVIGSAALIAGALAGGLAQLLLWAAMLVVDFGGGELISSYQGWRVRSPRYFAERHGLLVIIALGESITSVEVGVGDVPVNAAILTAALLGLAVTVCLWLSCFSAVAPALGRRLLDLDGVPRAYLARQAYTQLHFPLIVGVIYAALGIEQVFAHLSRPTAHDPTGPIAWLPLIALYGGVAAYLGGLAAIHRRVTGHLSRSRLVIAGVPLVLLPVASLLPALVALGLITALLAALALDEVLRSKTPEPAR